MDNVRILVTGGGAPGAYGIIKSLQQNSLYEVHSSDVNSDTVGAKMCVESYIVPFGDSPDYIEQMLSICKDNSIDILLPITTKEIVSLSKNSEKFENVGTKIIVCSNSDISILNNKGKLYQHLSDLGIEVPDFFIAKTVEEFEVAANKLGHPKQPFVFKPCVGNGSRGVRIVNTNSNELDQLFNQKPSSLHYSYSQSVSVLSSGDFPELVVSEFLSGLEYTVDCIAENGDVRLVVPRSRDCINNGISVQGRIIQNHEVIDYCTQILEAFHLDGPVGIQVKISQDGKPLLVEINPRLQGTTVACLGANVNFADLVVRSKLKMEIDWSKVNNNIAWGTSFVRHYDEIFY